MLASLPKKQALHAWYRFRDGLKAEHVESFLGGANNRIKIPIIDDLIQDLRPTQPREKDRLAVIAQVVALADRNVHCKLARIFEGRSWGADASQALFGQDIVKKLPQFFAWGIWSRFAKYP